MGVQWKNNKCRILKDDEKHAQLHVQSAAMVNKQ